MRNLPRMLLLFATLSGCDDIIEPDLSSKAVQLIAPSDSVVTSANVQTFWWKELDGALTYELHVVSTSFDSIVSVVLDTTLTKNQFQYTLGPGQFQWRVRALNGSSSTPYVIRTLFVDSAASLSGQSLLLNLPVDGVYTNDHTVALSWQSLGLASTYRLQVSEDGFSTSQYFYESEVSSTSASVQLDLEGEYSWRVRAESEYSVSLYSESRTIYLDETAPTTGSPIAPANNTSMPSADIAFSWQLVTDAGAPVFDSLFVYSDSLVTVHSKLVGVNGAATLNLSAGVYYWRVRSFDSAGNSGLYTTARKLTIL